MGKRPPLVNMFSDPRPNQPHLYLAKVSVFCARRWCLVCDKWRELSWRADCVCTNRCATHVYSRSFLQARVLPFALTCVHKNILYTYIVFMPHGKKYLFRTALRYIIELALDIAQNHSEPLWTTYIIIYIVRNRSGLDILRIPIGPK